MQSRQGRVHAAGTRGALDSTHTGFYPGTIASVPDCFLWFYKPLPYRKKKKAPQTAHKRAKQNIYERRRCRIINCKQPGT